MRVHLRVDVHAFAGDDAQAFAESARDQIEQRQDKDTAESQSPFEREHDDQDRRAFDQVGGDADDGVADGVLRADHVVVEAAHQLADFGVGEEAQTHPLQADKERHAQIIDHAFADGCV